MSDVSLPLAEDMAEAAGFPRKSIAFHTGVELERVRVDLPDQDPGKMATDEGWELDGPSRRACIAGVTMERARVKLQDYAAAVGAWEIDRARSLVPDADAFLGFLHAAAPADYKELVLAAGERIGRTHVVIEPVALLDCVRDVLHGSRQDWFAEWQAANPQRVDTVAAVLQPGDTILFPKE